MKFKTGFKYCILSLIFMLTVSFASAVWINSAHTHTVWHSANDIKVKLGQGNNISLQDWVNKSSFQISADLLSGDFYYEWDDSAHLVWHDAENIRIYLNGTYYTLQSWIDNEKVRWINSDYISSSWHDATEIKLILSDRNLSLQEWIDEITGQPVSDPNVLRNGDIIVLKHDTLEKYVSVAYVTDISMGSMTKGINVNRDTVSEHQLFTISENGTNKNGIIEYGEKVIFKSALARTTEIKYKYTNVFALCIYFQEWLHVNPDDKRCTAVFRPTILGDNSASGPVKSGDEVFFRDDDDKYWDVQVQKPVYHPSHRSSSIDTGKNRFNIYKNFTVSICSASSLEFCTYEQNCTAAGGHWYNYKCNLEPAKCSLSNLDLCTDSQNCTAVGGYWYDNRCNRNAESGTLTSYTEISYIGCAVGGGCKGGKITATCPSSKTAETGTCSCKFGIISSEKGIRNYTCECAEGFKNDCASGESSDSCEKYYLCKNNPNSGGCGNPYLYQRDNPCCNPIRATVYCS